MRFQRVLGRDQRGGTPADTQVPCLPLSLHTHPPRPPRYAGRALRMENAELFLGPYLCALAGEAGYDAVVLTGVPGARETHVEVLDVRPMTASYGSLVWAW